MIVDFLAEFIGALIATFIITRIFGLIFKRLLDKKTSIFVTFITSSVVILSISSFTMGFVNGFILYMFPLVIWLIVDLIRINKIKTKNAPNKESQV